MPVVSDYTAVLSGSSASTGAGVGAFISFSFPTSVPVYLHGTYTEEALATFRPFSDAEKAAARTALAAWASVSGLTFFEVAPGEGDIKFMNYDLTIMRPGAAGFAYYPSGTFENLFSGDVFIGDGYATDQHILLHEIGHTLGLQHPFDGTTTLPPDLDNFAHTVMSYTSGGTPGDVLGSFDLQAIQYLYGDNSNDGHQVASWSWNAATLTLTQNGGAGADTLIGIGGSDVLNAGGGNDLLIGHEGVNHMYGQDGDDELRSSIGAADSILDGGAGNDVINMSSASATLLGGAGNDTISIQYANDARYTIDGGDGADTLNIALWNFTGTNVSVPQMLVPGTTLAGIESVNIYGLDSTSTVSVTVDGSTANDYISLRGGNDFAYGHEGNDTLYGLGGNDTMTGDAGDDTLTGNTGNDVLQGGADNDWLWGGEDNDRLSGGTGNDWLFAGGGQDKLYGEDGDDHVTLNIGASLAGVVAEGGSGTDTLSVTFDVAATNFLLSSISATGFENTSLTGGSGADSITVDVAAGTVTLSGFGGNDTLKGGVGRDLIYGGDDNDLLRGESGEDYLSGGLGNDVLYGGADNDSLAGGGGQDQLYGNDGNDMLTLNLSGSMGSSLVNGGAGTDTLTIFFDDSAAVFTMDSSTVNTVENLTVLGGAAGDRMTASGAFVSIGLSGRGGNDVLDAGFTGATLDGDEGNDVIIAGTGFNFLYGGEDADRFVFASQSVSDTVSTDQIEDFETGLDKIDLSGMAPTNVLITTYAFGNYITADTVTGTFRLFVRAAVSMTDLILVATLPVGTPGSDNMAGTSGDDTLNGLGGDDLIDGGAGNDTLDGGDGVDTASYATATAGVTARIGLTTLQNTGGSGMDRLLNFENLTGSAYADTLLGNSFSNRLDGGAGADTMQGGKGDDFFTVDNAGDKVIELDGEGSDTIDSSVTYSLAGQYVEVLNLTGTAAINGTGNSLANRIVGNAAANILVGGDGSDRLDGAAGADTLKGGLGNDVYVVDQAGDKIVENDGEGTDTVEASFSYSIAGQYIEILKLMGTGDFTATGNGLANTLYGNSGNNTLNGGTGADTLYGGAGNDLYVIDNAGDRVFENSGEGTDTVQSSVSFAIGGQYIEAVILTGTAAINATGNSQANTLTGNTAANVLSGGGGDDALHGGLGSDTLTGGAGLDSYWFETALGASNVDSITDFNVADDTITLDRSIFAGVAANGALSAAAFFQGTAAHDADDRIVYNKATGNLYYDADGTGAGTAVLFAHVAANTALTAADFFAVA